MLPMSGLLAVAALDLDATCVAALTELAAHPGGLAWLDGSFDGFLTAQLPVPVAARRRLLEVLDLFGIAVGIAALRQGGGAARLRAVLRRISGVDAVIDRLVAGGAQVRYRRVLDAVRELEALAVSEAVSEAVSGAVSGAGAQIHAFLSSDDTVVARMAAATEAARVGGLEPGPTSALPRAVHWQRYGRTAPSGLHRACAVDITRGSLRLWSRAGGTPLRESRAAR
jgi:hypothetical protein